MSDSSVEYSHESWFSRIKSAVTGIVVGILLFVIAFPVLWFNEFKSVRVYKSLQEGRGAAVNILADSILPENETKLVHLSGDATTEEKLNDPMFGISVNAIRLVRTVEMYQWVEDKKETKEKNLGGSTTTKTTYTYKREWEKDHVDSTGFNDPKDHQNPSSMPITSDTQQASKVTVGAFGLSSQLISQIKNSQPFTPPSLQINGLPPTIKTEPKLAGNQIYISNPVNQSESATSNSGNPAVGDIRVTYRVVKPQTVSIVAKQDGKTLGSYSTKAGEPICILAGGKQTADEMFTQAEKSNAMWTWIKRFIGFILMLIGISMMLKPISVLADVIPFFGNIVEVGLGILAFLIALPLTLITIAVAWVAARPLIGVPLLILGIAVIIGGVVLVMKKKQTPAEATA